MRLFCNAPQPGVQDCRQVSLNLTALNSLKAGSQIHLTPGGILLKVDTILVLISSHAIRHYVLVFELLKIGHSASLGRSASLCILQARTLC